MRSMMEGRGNQVLHVCKQSEDSTFPGPLHRPPGRAPPPRAAGEDGKRVPQRRFPCPRRPSGRSPCLPASRGRMEMRGWN